MHTGVVGGRWRPPEYGGVPHAWGTSHQKEIQKILVLNRRHLWSACNQDCVNRNSPSHTRGTRGTLNNLARTKFLTRASRSTTCPT